LTKQDELVAAITGAVTTAVMEAIDTKLDKLTCPLNECEKKSVQHLYGLFKDAGDGDMDRGIRKFRGILEFTGSIYNWRNIISGAVILAAVMGVVGWCAKLFISGLVATMRGL